MIGGGATYSVEWFLKFLSMDDYAMMNADSIKSGGDWSSPLLNLLHSCVLENANI